VVPGLGSSSLNEEVCRVDWNKTKTIFILVFLILDLFLIYQYFEKKNSNQYELIAESTFEERLSENEIKYTALPKESMKERYVSSKSKIFTEDDIKKLNNQVVTLYSNQKLFAKLEKPFPLSEGTHNEALDAFVKETILNGDLYKYWDYDKATNAIIYYQTYNDKMFYNNMNGKLVLYMNANREVTSYEQTLLENIEEFNEKEEVLPAIKAIETLFSKGYLKPKSKITKVELGYYTLVQLTASHVLTPTWRIVINDEENMYVNALEGQIIQFDTEDKILE
jgi:regulatory protein YycI of two-component signal transduction system YycFG